MSKPIADHVTFARKLASAKRKLEHPHPAAHDPYAALTELRSGEKLTDWFLFGLVGTGEVDFIPSTVSDEKALQAIRIASPIKGTAGIVRIGDRLCTYVMPFLPGQKTVDELTDVIAQIKGEMFAEMKRLGQTLPPDRGGRKE